jgi:ribosomal protein S18 acetylase RimI-like enzyme
LRHRVGFECHVSFFHAPIESHFPLFAKGTAPFGTAPNEKMIGVVDVVPNNYEGNPQAAYLSLLMIAASYRNLGIGRTVLEAVEHELRQDAQVTEMLLGVQANNPQALRFWQRCGYRIIAGPKMLPDQTIVYDMRKAFSVEL